MNKIIVLCIIPFLLINCKDQETNSRESKIVNGKQIEKYPNGKIKEVINWSNNKKVGESFSYNYNGKLKSFDFYNLDEKIVYQRLYNNEGKLFKENGEIDPMFIVDIDKFNKESTLFAKIFIVEPPNTEVSIEVFLVKPGDTIKINSQVHDKIILIDQKITDTSYTKFLLKSYIKDYDKGIKWDQMNLLNLKGKFDH